MKEYILSFYNVDKERRRLKINAQIGQDAFYFGVACAKPITSTKFNLPKFPILMQGRYAMMMLSASSFFLLI